MAWKLAVDIGGTFTDVVLADGSNVLIAKRLTTHLDPSNAVIDCVGDLLDESQISAQQVGIVIHGTTLATNAIIERKGARTALITTEGHRDVIEMAYENRFEQYDLNIERPQPLIPRHLRIPIPERIAADGSVLRELDMSAVDSASGRLQDLGVESLAIGFLHAYANASHEERVAARLRELNPGLAISLSSRVCPEIREYERLSTTATNAYVLPLMRDYLRNMATRLKRLGFECPLFMMTSGGGLTTIANAEEFPIRLVESGPAGGAILAGQIAESLSQDRLLSFDMGGTTAKICLIDNARPTLSRSFEVDRRYRFKRGSGLPIRIPVIEMIEIGAGGGSIATLDRLGRLTVGPESAGSQPGPACYGQGGVRPCVTDADVVLGHFDNRAFAKSIPSLDVEAALKSMDEITASVGSDPPTRQSATQAAGALTEVVDENMVAASRRHGAEGGHAIEGRLMVAFGGAAPLHAARLIEKLDLAGAVIPVNAGVGSAIGFLLAPVAYEVVRTKYATLSNLDVAEVSRVIEDMRNEAEDVVSSAEAENLAYRVRAYMRYVGQGYEVAVPIDSDKINRDYLTQQFESAYKKLYHRTIPLAEIEIMSWTLSVSSPTNRLPDCKLDDAFTDAVPAKMSQVMYYANRKLNAQIYPRDSLSTHQRIAGPALIVEAHTTTLVPDDFTVKVLSSGDLLLNRST